MILLYFFHTDWCTKCKTFEKAFDNGDLDIPNVVSVDADKASQALLKTWNIEALPTFILVDQDHDEKELGRLVSPETKGELLDWYHHFAQKWCVLTLKTED